MYLSDVEDLLLDVFSAIDWNNDGELKEDIIETARYILDHPLTYNLSPAEVKLWLKQNDIKL